MARPMDAREDLAVIRELMEEGRRLVCGGSRHYVVWAVLVTAALVLTYMAEVGGLAVEEGWIWLGAVGLGWVLSLWIGWREEGRAPVRGPMGLILGNVWIGAGIAMTLTGFLGGLGGSMTGSGLMGAIACMIGAAMFASAAAYDAAWPRWLAVGWWAGGAGILLWPGPHTLLIMAGLMVGLQLLPGLVLLREERHGSPGAAGAAVGPDRAEGSGAGAP